MSRLCIAPTLLGALLLSTPARAQTAAPTPPLPTPDEIQTMIADGQAGEAVQALDNVLAAHPRDARAWYLLAVADAARNDEQDAGLALNMAVRCSPGLPFADPQELAALKTHIANAQPQAAHTGRNSLLAAIGLVLLAVLLSFAPSRKVKRRAPGQPEREPPYGFGYPSETAAPPPPKPAQADASHDDLSNTGWS